MEQSLFIMGFFAAIALGCSLGLIIVILNAVRVDLNRFSKGITEVVKKVQSMEGVVKGTIRRSEEALPFRVNSAFREALKDDQGGGEEVPRQWSPDWMSGQQ